MWNNLKLKLYLWWYMPKTRIQAGYDAYYREFLYLPQNRWSNGEDSGWVMMCLKGFSTLQEAKDHIDKFLEKRRKELIEKFNTPKTKYIKYP